MMDPNVLRDQLMKLHEELSLVKHVDPGSKQLLDEIREDIKRLMEQSADASVASIPAAAPRTLSDRLEKVACNSRLIIRRWQRAHVASSICWVKPAYSYRRGLRVSGRNAWEPPRGSNRLRSEPVRRRFRRPRDRWRARARVPQDCHGRGSAQSRLGSRARRSASWSSRTHA